MQKKKQTLANKQGRIFWLNSLALKRISECPASNGGIIPFPDIFEKLCRSFQIKKKDAWKLIYLFRDLGFLKIVCGHGVILNGNNK